MYTIRCFSKRVAVDPTPNLTEEVEQRKHLFLTLGKEEGGVDFISTADGNILLPTKPVLLGLIGGYFQNKPGGIRVWFNGQVEEFGLNTDELLPCWQKRLVKATANDEPRDS